MLPDSIDYSRSTAELHSTRDPFHQVDKGPIIRFNQLIIIDRCCCRRHCLHSSGRFIITLNSYFKFIIIFRYLLSCEIFLQLLPSAPFYCYYPFFIYITSYRIVQRWRIWQKEVYSIDQQYTRTMNECAGDANTTQKRDEGEGGNSIIIIIIIIKREREKGSFFFFLSERFLPVALIILYCKVTPCAASKYS